MANRRSRISSNPNPDAHRMARFLEEFLWLLSTYPDFRLGTLSTAIREQVHDSSEAKAAVGGYASSNPNKHFLVGVLPRLFVDASLFPTNDDIAQFALTVMKVTIPRHHKKSKIELIGHIVCQTNDLDDAKLARLVKALAVVAEGDDRTKSLIKKRKEQNFGWNAIIQELSASQGHGT